MKPVPQLMSKAMLFPLPIKKDAADLYSSSGPPIRRPADYNGGNTLS